MTISTLMATSAKQEFLQAGHNFSATVTPTATASSGSTSVTTVSSMASVCVGSSVTGTGIASNTVVARITGAAAMDLSKATTAAITGGTLTISGDTFMIALIKPSMAGTYNASSVNYTDIVGNSDEVPNGSGYTTTGLALTNAGVATGSTTAYTSFSSNPQFTSATFSTAGCMIYNSSVRNGGTSGTNTTGGGRCISVYDFGGTQSVSAGTFSVLLPTNNSTSAVIRIA